VAGGVISPYFLREEPNREYEYCVTAYNPADESDFSNWNRGVTKARPGVRIFTNGGNFYVPLGITELTVCLQGGGGSGAIGESDGLHSGGGFAGQFIKQTIKVNEGDVIAVQVGQGGEHTDYTTPADGVPGTETKVILYTLEEIVANGGRGGLHGSTSFAGVGRSLVSDCTGETYDDGLHSYRPDYVSCYGGQASQFGNGGSRSGTETGLGAGGSAISKHQEYYDNPAFNKGGGGVVMFAWFDETENTLTELGVDEIVTVNKQSISNKFKG
jgi:hypothetical protein